MPSVRRRGGSDDPAQKLLFAVLLTSFVFPIFWRETGKWARSESGPTNWPPTPARVRLVRGGLIAFLATEWTGVALAAI